jgi:hypothetical protein
MDQKGRTLLTVRYAARTARQNGCSQVEIEAAIQPDILPGLPGQIDTLAGDRPRPKPKSDDPNYAGKERTR